MQVQGVLETCLYVDDLAAAETFYQEVLGLIAFSRVEDRHLFFRCGQGVLLLFNPVRTAIAEGNVPTHGAYGPGHIAFATTPAELEDWRSHLTACGVTLETEITWPSEGVSLYFRDPAGNSVELATPQLWGL